MDVGVCFAAGVGRPPIRVRERASEGKWVRALVMVRLAGVGGHYVNEMQWQRKEWLPRGRRKSNVTSNSPGLNRRPANAHRAFTPALLASTNTSAPQAGPRKPHHHNHRHTILLAMHAPAFSAGRSMQTQSHRRAILHNALQRVPQPLSPLVRRPQQRERRCAPQRVAQQQQQQLETALADHAGPTQEQELKEAVLYTSFKAHDAAITSLAVLRDDPGAWRVCSCVHCVPQQQQLQ